MKHTRMVTKVQPIKAECVTIDLQPGSTFNAAAKGVLKEFLGYERVDTGQLNIIRMCK